MAEMKRVCCVCKKFLGTKPSDVDGTTHGYCSKCADEALAELQEHKRWTEADERRWLEIVNKSEEN